MGTYQVNWFEKLKLFLRLVSEFMVNNQTALCF